MLLSAASYAGPVLFYSDLTSGPKTGGENNKGVFVSVYGKGFGSTQSTSTATIGGGLADNYPLWSDTKIVFQLGSLAATGNIIVTVGGDASNALPFTVRSGNIYFCTPTGTGDGSFASPFDPSDYCALLAAGEDGATCYFRAGTYEGEYANTSWHANFSLKNSYSGASGNENAFVAYPGETATLSAPDSNISYNFRRYDNSGDHGGGYIVVAGFTCASYGSSIYPGSNTRIIGNTITGQTGGDFPAGIIGIDGLADGTWAVDDVKIYGNSITGGAGSGTQDHAIYPGYGVDNIDIGWNYIYGSDGLGSKISFNNNNAYALNMVWENIRVHHNFIDVRSSQYDKRAINVFESGTGSTFYIYDNIIIGDSGDQSSTISILSGTVYLYNNTVYAGSSAALGLVYLYSQTVYSHNYVPESVTMSNNIFYAAGDATKYIKKLESAGTVPDPTMSNNLWYGIGAFADHTDFTTTSNDVESDPLFTTTPPITVASVVLQSGSPADGAGTALSAVSSLFTIDYYGVTLQDPVDIGAIAYGSGSSVPSTSGIVTIGTTGTVRVIQTTGTVQVIN